MPTANAVSLFDIKPAVPSKATSAASLARSETPFHETLKQSVSQTRKSDKSEKSDSKDTKTSTDTKPKPGAKKGKADKVHHKTKADETDEVDSENAETDGQPAAEVTADQGDKVVAKDDGKDAKVVAKDDSHDDGTDENDAGALAAQATLKPQQTVKANTKTVDGEESAEDERDGKLQAVQGDASRQGGDGEDASATEDAQAPSLFSDSSTAANGGLKPTGNANVAKADAQNADAQVSDQTAQATTAVATAALPAIESGSDSSSKIESVEKALGGDQKTGSTHSDSTATPLMDFNSTLHRAAEKISAANETAQTTPAQVAETNHSKIVSSVHGQLLPNGGTMQIRLDPPELGALQVSVHMKDGVMTASFETSNADATRMLSHSLSDLKAALEQSGISVEKLHVQQGAKQESSDSGQQGSGQQSQYNAEDQASRREQQRKDMLNRMWKKLSGGDPLDLVA